MAGADAHTRAGADTPAATLWLSLTMTADVVATLAGCLASLKAGRLARALLPAEPGDPLLTATAALGDLLAASALRTLCLTLALGTSAACAGRRAALAALAAGHALLVAWLAAKAALTYALAGGAGPGAEFRAGGVTLRVPALLATEALGILFSG